MSKYDSNSSDLEYLQKQRDKALEYEKNSELKPRSSSKFMKAQEEIDKFFLGSGKKKKKDKKKKKKTFVPDDKWAY